jgi:hypothetical protein
MWPPAEKTGTDALRWAHLGAGADEANGALRVVKHRRMLIARTEAVGDNERAHAESVEPACDVGALFVEREVLIPAAGKITIAVPFALPAGARNR